LSVSLQEPPDPDEGHDPGHVTAIRTPRERPPAAGRGPFATGCNRRPTDGVFMDVMDERAPGDAHLAAGLASDLDGTFESLILAHQDRLFTIAYRIGGDRQDAEELVQDTFVRAYRAMAGYAPARVRDLRLRA